MAQILITLVPHSSAPRHAGAPCSCHDSFGSGVANRCGKWYGSVGQKGAETQLFGGKKIILVDSGGRICYNKLQI